MANSKDICTCTRGSITYRDRDGTLQSATVRTACSQHVGDERQRSTRIVAAYMKMVGPQRLALPAPHAVER